MLQKGKVDSVRVLIEGGADVDAADEDEQTALMLAAEKGETGIINALIELDADVNAADEDGKTILMHASYFEMLTSYPY